MVKTCPYRLYDPAHLAANVNNEEVMILYWSHSINPITTGVCVRESISTKYGLQKPTSASRLVAIFAGSHFARCFCVSTVQRGNELQCEAMSTGFPSLTKSTLAAWRETSKLLRRTMTKHKTQRRTQKHKALLCLLRLLRSFSYGLF